MGWERERASGGRVATAAQEPAQPGAALSRRLPARLHQLAAPILLLTWCTFVNMAGTPTLSCGRLRRASSADARGSTSAAARHTPALCPCWAQCARSCAARMWK